MEKQEITKTLRKNPGHQTGKRKKVKPNRYYKKQELFMPLCKWLGEIILKPLTDNDKNVIGRRKIHMP